jgi:RNA polymerase sigma factor (sigma-70 family)
MTASDEITRWIDGLADGDDLAAQMIWEKYFDRLVRYARRKLEKMPRRAVDEEDVALSAMHSFCDGMARGKFESVHDRDDLWKLLLTITARKAVAQMRRHHTRKRGGGSVRGESVFVRADNADGREIGIGEVLGDAPTPELAAMVAENCDEMLNRLEDERLREIALKKLEGYTNDEIAEQLGCVRRSVERKLERIRSRWSREAEQ